MKFQRLWARVPQPWRYVFVLLLVCAFSVGGVVWAVRYQCPEEGGRGGAIATIFSFAILLPRRDYGLRRYQLIEERIASSMSGIERLRTEHRALVKALQINSAGQAQQNGILIAASVTGAVFWGFGDMLARYLLHRPIGCGM